MALFYFVRHGEADYSQLLEKGFFGFGRDFAPLSKIGIEQVEKTAKEFYENKGLYPNGQQLRWETLEEVRKRMQCVVEKYVGYEKVIFVGHSMAFETLTGINEMQPAEILEWEN